MSFFLLQRGPGRGGVDLWPLPDGQAGGGRENLPGREAAEDRRQAAGGEVQGQAAGGGAAECSGRGRPGPGALLSDRVGAGARPGGV
eukprot:scaffold403363_cov30-Prasinocladus_malaysianus.AAC.1